MFSVFSSRRHLAVKLGLLFSLSGIASLVFAHDGHDHSHWMSGAIHMLTVLAVVAIVFAVARLIETRVKARASKKL